MRVTVPELDISSTRIRTLIAAGRSVLRTVVRVVRSLSSERSSSTARFSRLRSSVLM